jgi:histidinol-phosphate aminotransferase
MTTGSRFTVPENILKIEPYIPGKPEEELMRELGLSHVIKMASNENCLGPSPAATQAMALATTRVHRYPDSGGYYLKKALSQKFGFPMEQIILGNGSTDLIDMLARTYLQSSSNSIIGDQTFLMYRVVTMAMNAECKAVPIRDFHYDLDGIIAAVNDRTKIIFLANPNNPTGTIISKSAFEAFLSKIPSEVLIVLDEAYFEYVEDEKYFTGLDFLNEYQNLIVLRTFSKIHGLAGIRMGFGIACEEVISNVNRIRSPFNTNLVAQAGAKAALEDINHIQKSKEHNQNQRKILEDAFRSMNIPFVPSNANFVLLLMQDAEQIYKELLLHGIIVRSMKSLRCNDGLRVTIGKAEENQAFLKALKALI